MNTYWPVLVALVVMLIWVGRLCWLLWPRTDGVTESWLRDAKYERDGDRD